MRAECECGNTWTVGTSVTRLVSQDHKGPEFTLGLMCSECASKRCSRCNGGKGWDSYSTRGPAWVDCYECNGSGMQVHTMNNQSIESGGAS